MKAGWEMSKQYNNKTLAFHLMYGKMLNEVLPNTSSKKTKGKQTAHRKSALKKMLAFQHHREEKFVS